MKKKSGSWPVLLLIASLFLGALFAWWFRGDLGKWFGDPKKGAPSEKTNSGAPEKITEEERKKLDEVLKRR